MPVGGARWDALTFLLAQASAGWSGSEAGSTLLCPLLAGDLQSRSRRQVEQWLSHANQRLDDVSNLRCLVAAICCKLGRISLPASPVVPERTRVTISGVWYGLGDVAARARSAPHSPTRNVTLTTTLKITRPLLSPEREGDIGSGQYAPWQVRCIIVRSDSVFLSKSAPF